MIEIIGKYNPKTDVLVKVIDSERNIVRRFSCNKNKVIKRMKYFTSLLNERVELDELDISVSCDVFIFEMLVKFLNEGIEPHLDAKHAVMILASA